MSTGPQPHPPAATADFSGWSALVLALLQTDKPTATWVAEFDEAVMAASGRSRSTCIDHLAEAIRLHFLGRHWDWYTADHAINLLAGYALAHDERPAAFWAIYLAFDDSELTHPASLPVLMARLARTGDRVKRNVAHWVASEFDDWGRGQGTGTVVDAPMPVDDLHLVDVRWPSGRCFEPVSGLIWCLPNQQHDR